MEGRKIASRLLFLALSLLNSGLLYYMFEFLTTFSIIALLPIASTHKGGCLRNTISRNIPRRRMIIKNILLRSTLSNGIVERHTIPRNAISPHVLCSSTTPHNRILSIRPLTMNIPHLSIPLQNTRWISPRELPEQVSKSVQRCSHQSHHCLKGTTVVRSAWVASGWYKGLCCVEAIG